MTAMTAMTAMIFPCNFEIKVMGKHTTQFTQELLLFIEQQHTKPITHRHTMSKDNKYISLTVKVAVSSQLELDNLYKSLHARSDVLMLL